MIPRDMRRRSKCAEESRRAQIEEELAMTPLERVLLALEIGIETQAMFEPHKLCADLGEERSEPT